MGTPAPDAVKRLTFLLMQSRIRPHGDDSVAAGIRKTLRHGRPRDPRSLGVA